MRNVSRTQSVLDNIIEIRFVGFFKCSGFFTGCVVPCWFCLQCFPLLDLAFKQVLSPLQE